MHEILICDWLDFQFSELLLNFSSVRIYYMDTIETNVGGRVVTSPIISKN